LRVSVASESGRPDGRNEDWAGATAKVAIVLDGLSEADETGCIHGTPWYVHQLGCRLLTHAGDSSRTLADALATAISDVAALHADVCNLSHPGSPCSTVAMVREADETMEYLILSDSVVVLDRADNSPLVIVDKSVDQFASKAAKAAKAAPTVGKTGSKRALQALIDEQLKVRNRPGGYWIAQVDPEAAQYAKTGSVSGVQGAAVLSDGAALVVTDFHIMDWATLLSLGYERGPGELIATTRALEDRDPHGVVWPRYKHRDDATAVICQMRQ
jgi:hypothetical protein